VKEGNKVTSLLCFPASQASSDQGLRKPRHHQGPSTIYPSPDPMTER